MKRTIKEVMTRYADVCFKLVVLNETYDWLDRQFSERDGMIATQLMLTDDGRAVPQDTIRDVLADIQTQITLLETERAEIEETQIK